MFGRFKSEKVTYKIIEMKTGLLILLAFILSSITSVEAQERKNGKTMEKEERPLQAGDRCPNFSFEDIDGKKVTLKSLKGKYIFIDIWATWCPPCRDELPFLKVLEEKFKDRNIWFVSISCDKDKKKWVEMVKREKLGGIQLHMGDDWSFMEAFGNRKIPRFILVDPKGKIISPKTSRPSEPGTEVMLKALKGL